MGGPATPVSTPAAAVSSTADEFGTVLMDRRSLEAALDLADAGIRTVAARAGAADVNVTTDWNELVGAAVTGAWRQAGHHRVTFDLAFLALGDHARDIVGRVSDPAPTASDPVVAQSLVADGPDTALATRLLRLAMATQRSGSAELDGVIRLKRMGFVLTTDSRGPVLLGQSGRIPLSWSGEANPLTARAPGMLRPRATSEREQSGLG